MIYYITGFAFLILLVLLYIVWRLLFEFRNIITIRKEIDYTVKLLGEQSRWIEGNRIVDKLEIERINALKKSIDIQSELNYRLTEYYESETKRKKITESDLQDILKNWADFQSQIIKELTFFTSIKPLLLRTIMDPALFISGISAVLQAVQTWIEFRDSKRAAKEFELRYRTALSDPTIVQEANELSSIVPVEILDTMLSRARKCWDRYHEVLQGEYLPGEIDEATNSLKACICRELRRIEDLNGSIPDGTLSLASARYCKK